MLYAVVDGMIPWVYKIGVESDSSVAFGRVSEITRPKPLSID